MPSRAPIPRRRAKRRLLAALSAAAMLAAPAAPAAGAATVGFFDHHAAQEAFVSEMTIHSAAIDTGGTTCIAYQGKGFDPYICSYETSSGEWAGPYRIGTNLLSLDAHGAPALFRDASGHLHALYGSHNGVQSHAEAAPGRIDAWAQLPIVDDVGTYPQAVERGGGDTLLYHRGRYYHWYERDASGECTTFSAPRTILEANAADRWYADFRGGPSGAVHATFVRLDVAEYLRWEYSRHDVYYMRRDPSGTWFAADGTTLSMPVDRAEADAHCRVLDTGTDWANEVSVKEDAAGSPCILALVGSGAGAGHFGWTFLRHDGTAWNSAEITTTDHFFDSGALNVTGPDSFEAFLVTGDSDAEGSAPGDYRGRGGTITRWTSDTGGADWALADPQVSPAEPLSLFGDPVLVRDATSTARVAFTDWNNDESDFFRRLFLWGDSGLVTRTVPCEVERVAGATRAATAIAASKRAFPEGARQVVLARQDDFPDALTGAPLAHALHAPLLLTSPSSITPGVVDEIRRLKVTRVVVLGGPSAVSAKVESQLEAAGLTVQRLWGATRYDTALAIARSLRDPTRAEPYAVVVSGRNWPDAVAAAPVAANLGCPILLTETGALPAQTALALREWGTRRTLVVGGTGVIAPAVLDRLPSPERVGGADRYETSALLARWGIANALLPGRVTVATGWGYPDALSGGPLAARARGPVLLTPREELPPSVEAYLADVSGSLVDVYVMGEADVVGDAVLDRISQLAP